MKKEQLNEKISEQEFISILKSGDIKMKRLIVGGHSKLDGLQLKFTGLPKDVLMGPLIRENKVILPDGDTKLEHGDVIILFGKEKDLDITKELLSPVSIWTRFRVALKKLIKAKTKNNSLPG